MKKINDQGLNKDGSLKTEKQLVWSMWPNSIQPNIEKQIVKTKCNTAIISCNTRGASIAYQINGKGYSEKSWFVYSKPLQIKEGDKISALAIRIGFKESEKAVKND